MDLVMRSSTFLVALVLWLAFARDVSARQEHGFPYQHRPDRSRVVVVEDPSSMVTFNPVPEVVAKMVNRGITSLTAKETLADAWRSLVSTQDTIGIKVTSSPGPTIGTRPAVVAAVVKGLIEAGVPPAQVLIWDRHTSDLARAGFFDLAQRFGVRVAGSADEGYDESAYYETALLGRLVWGDHEFGKRGEEVGRRSFVSKLVTRKMTKIINITPLLNHNDTYVLGNLSSLALGSVDNSLRFVSMPGRLAQAIPEIYALEQLSDRVVLNIVDALICQYLGEERTVLHYSTMLRQLRFSTDPVALDVLSIHELTQQRQLAGIPPVKIDWQIYTNASLLELGSSDLRQVDIIRIAREL
jgi:hypothetical protein